MTDRDFARIQAAFPALTWHWHTPSQLRGEVPPVGGLSVTVEHYGRILMTRVLVRHTIVWQYTSDGPLSAALSAARAAVAALRDDSTAALGEP